MRSSASQVPLPPDPWAGQPTVQIALLRHTNETKGLIHLALVSQVYALPDQGMEQFERNRFDETRG